ncbi:dihydropteroate synthase [Campylobacterota bacterium]|nr:dihydropteroate synthase [Campylobacterota bacterium]
MVEKLEPSRDLAHIMNAIGCHKNSIDIMLSKAHKDHYYIKNLSCGAANILKQDALSIGAELAVHRGAADCSTSSTDALLFATKSELKRLIEKEKTQPFSLKTLAAELEEFIAISTPRIVPKIMGIININNDSFNAASRTAAESVATKAETMIRDGAEYIDIGAVSSRPGSDRVTPEVELDRLKLAIDTIYKTRLHERAVFSLDSYEPLPIKYALDHGFGMINDITGAANDEVAILAAKYGVELCIMHMAGDPKTMQQHIEYDDVVQTVDRFFADRIAKAKDHGAQKIVLDVGVGFGKTAEHNLKLIAAQTHFLHFGYPLLIGASRKSVIDHISPSAVSDRLAGTIALHLKAVDCGASIVRCHDVFEHAQAIKIWSAFNSL